MFPWLGKKAPAPETPQESPIQPERGFVDHVCRVSPRAVGCSICEEFIVANYEDYDFCLHLREIGSVHWYYPEVALAHIEGASQKGIDGTWLRNASHYSAWLQTRRHDDAIRRLMSSSE